jgi:hypothetical protein
MDSEYCQAQIDILKPLIAAYQAVLLQLAQNPNKSYTLNTGQTTESVSKYDIDKIRDMVNGLQGDLQYWYDCLNNTGTSILGPAY